jgi:hypothetical protein
MREGIDICKSPTQGILRFARGMHINISTVQLAVWFGSLLCYTNPTGNRFATSTWVWTACLSGLRAVLQDSKFSVHMIHEHNVSPKTIAWWASLSSRGNPTPLGMIGILINLIGLAKDKCEPLSVINVQRLLIRTYLPAWCTKAGSA